MPSNPASPSQRFDLLDGIRGIAALAVMFHHYTQHNGLHWLGGAWVAVDLFFVLSGFVVAHSYGQKIIDGMSFREFLRVRMIRLGPLYYLGLALGTLAAVYLVITASLSGTAVLQAALLNLFWLPDVNTTGWPFGKELIPSPIFPLNDPGWTLFFELVANLVFFAFVQRFKKVSSLWLVVPACALFLYYSFVQDHVHPGWGSENYLYAFPRVIAEFFTGTLIYAVGLHRHKLHRICTWIALGVTALTIIRFDFWEHALLSSVTLVPLTIMLASTVQPAGLARRICQVLGDLSYPLYILHFPLFRLADELTGLRALSPVAQTLLMASVSIVLAMALGAADLRLRRWLLRRTRPAGAVLKAA